MERLVFLIFLCASFERYTGEHIFVSKEVTWPEAQSYCKQHYTDLSYIRNNADRRLLKEAAGGSVKNGWIGLQRDPNNKTAWKWSGTGYSRYFNWDSTEPNVNGDAENYVKIWENGKWIDEDIDKINDFYCFRLNTPETRLSWEDAWRHCRDNHTKLFSLAHDLDREMALNVFQRASITKQVWIGLRYLGDRWFWMNNDDEVDQGWAAGDQDHMCPKEKRCGAFTEENNWVSWDCLDKLNFICT